MAGLPDPLGGIGYANVFEGNKALDFFREDLKRKEAKRFAESKAKAERKAKIKPLDQVITGWRIYDQMETNEMYKVLLDEAARKKREGEDFRDDPEFMSTMTESLELAKTNTVIGEKYEKDLGKVEKLDITREQKQEWEEKWINIATVGGTIDPMKYKPGGMKARRALVLEEGLPELPVERVDWRVAHISLVSNTEEDITQFWHPDQNITEERKKFAKKTIDANWDLYTDTPEGQSEISEYAKANNVSIDKAEQKTKQRYIDQLPSYIKQTFKRPLKDGKGWDWDWGGGSGGNNNINVVYDTYTPELLLTNEKRREIFKNVPFLKDLLGSTWRGVTTADTTPRDALTFSSAKGGIIKPQNITAKINSIKEESVEGYIPTQVWIEPDGRILTIGEGRYQDAKGTTKTGDIIFEIDKNNRIQFQTKFLGGQDIEEAIEKFKGGSEEKTTTAEEIKSLVGQPGYEDYTYEELVEYYKSQGYTIK